MATQEASQSHAQARGQDGNLLCHVEATDGYGSKFSHLAQPDNAHIYPTWLTLAMGTMLLGLICHIPTSAGTQAIE